jgi:hypothetical protein
VGFYYYFIIIIFVWYVLGLGWELELGMSADFGDRQYQSMQSACEELRTMDEPGTKDSGRLYRIAMEKKGIFGKGGVPIEYARLQVETPAKEAWNHGWTR